MQNQEELRLTVYSRNGYSGILAIKKALASIGIESSITAGGLSAYVLISKYESFIEALEAFPGASFLGGESVRWNLDRWNKMQTNGDDFKALADALYDFIERSREHFEAKGLDASSVRTGLWIQLVNAYGAGRTWTICFNK